VSEGVTVKQPTQFRKHSRVTRNERR